MEKLGVSSELILASLALPLAPVPVQQHRPQLLQHERMCFGGLVPLELEPEPDPEPDILEHCKVKYLVCKNVARQEN